MFTASTAMTFTKTKHQRKPAIDTLAAAGEVHRAYRIDLRIELFPPAGVHDAEAVPKPASDKGAITCARTAPSSSP